MTDTATVPVVRLNQAEPDLSAGRYCVNCRWVIAAGLRCDAPQSWAETTNLVTGHRERKQEYSYCVAHRQSPARSDICGIEGQWFEAAQRNEAAE